MIHRRITLCIENYFSEFQPIIQGIYRYARGAADWEVTLTMERFKESILEWKPDGIIAHVHNQLHLDLILEQSIPTVCTTLWPTKLDCHRVVLDEQATGRAAANYLCDLGPNSIYYVPLSESEEESTWIGFREAAEKRSRTVLKLPAPFVNPCEFTLDPVSEKTREWFLRFPKPAPLFVRCDVLAMRLIESAKSLGLRVPEDVSILGAGNNDFLCQLSDPTLSSVRVSMENCGFEAAQLLNQVMDFPNQKRTTIKVPPLGVVVQRASTIEFVTSDPLFDKAMGFIRVNYAKGISIKDVVRASGISRSTLERRFREHLGVVPTDEILRLRLQKACELLTDMSKSLREVAAESGFGDTRGLNHAMEKQLNTTPQAFRELATKGKISKGES